MLSNILEAVIRRLRELYGEEVQIDTEPVTIAAQSACFIVGFTETDEKQMLGQRYQKTSRIRIRYIPSEGQTDQSAAWYRIIDTLSREIRYITLDNGDLVRGTKISSRTEGNFMDFYVSYSMFLIEGTLAQDIMEQTDVAGSMKGGEDGNSHR